MEKKREKEGILNFNPTDLLEKRQKPTILWN
jgi:hypothetical protein